MDGAPAIIQLVKLPVCHASIAHTENLKFLALEFATFALDTEPLDDSE